MYLCIKCNKELSDSTWYKCDKNKSNYICKTCTTERTKEWRKNNPDKVKEIKKRNRNNNREKYNLYRNNYYKRHKEDFKKYNSNCKYKTKIEVYSHYCGNEIKCMNINCLVPGGCKDIRALSIDHINGGGTKHIKDNKIKSLTNWLKQNNFPEGFQVLCMNCQFIKRYEKDELNRNK
jgi:hypothetical protein